MSTAHRCRAPVHGDAGRRPGQRDGDVARRHDHRHRRQLHLAERLTRPPATASRGSTRRPGRSCRCRSTASSATAGTQASIYNLYGDANGFYGVGYVFGAGGNLEGTFSADWNGGRCAGWRTATATPTTCTPSGDVTYTRRPPALLRQQSAASRRPTRGRSHYANAFTQRRGSHRSTAEPLLGYSNFAGTPGAEPAQLTSRRSRRRNYTGARTRPPGRHRQRQLRRLRRRVHLRQRHAQQGLVRMAVAVDRAEPAGPAPLGDELAAARRLVPAAPPASPSAANWDRDNETLTYKVYRDSTANVINTQVVTAPFWNLPAAGRSSTPDSRAGHATRYRVSATDASGNTDVHAVGRRDHRGATLDQRLRARPSSTTTRSTTGASASRPADHGRTTGPASTTPRPPPGSPAATPGAIIGDADTASTFNGDANGLVAGAEPGAPDPNTFGLEAWFKTTTHRRRQDRRLRQRQHRQSARATTGTSTWTPTAGSTSGCTRTQRADDHVRGRPTTTASGTRWSRRSAPTA